MCFHLIPDLKVAMACGVVFSESIAVTDTGSDVLTPYPQEIFFK